MDERKVRRYFLWQTVGGVIFLAIAAATGRWELVAGAVATFVIAVLVTRRR